MKEITRVYIWNVPDEIKKGKTVYAIICGDNGPELTTVNELKYSTFLNLTDDNSMFFMMREEEKNGSENNVDQCEQ